MNRAFDLTEVRLLLRKGVDAGFWTVDDLDQPSGHFTENLSPKVAEWVNGPRRALTYRGVTYINPLRDVPSEPAVEITSPRDFAPAHPSPGILPGHPPLPLSGQLDQSLDHHRGQRQDPSPDETDHEYPF